MEILLNYTDLKAVIQAKNLLWQYTDLTEKYLVFSVDGPIAYFAPIYKSGYLPIGFDATQNTADKSDFESNYQSTANAKVESTLAPAKTGTITANAQTVVSPVYGSNGCALTISGTYAGVSLFFEISNDSQTSWYTINGATSDDSTTYASSIALATNVNRTYSFTWASATHFRVRCAAYTSGTMNVRIIPSNATPNDGVVVIGDVLHDDAENALAPVKIGGVARTTNPTAVASGDRTHAIFDDVGRQVVILGHVRDLITNANITITSSTSETTLLAAGGSGVFHDVTSLVLSNSSASATNVSIRDATGGTVRMVVRVNAGSVVLLTFDVPFTQVTANNNWTAQCGTSVASVNIFVNAIKNV